jgi:hypothetical protein
LNRIDRAVSLIEESLTAVDVVLDTVGGDTQQRSLRVLKPGGILVSVVSPVLETTQKRYGVRAAYFYVDVTTARLNKITELFDSGKTIWKRKNIPRMQTWELGIVFRGPSGSIGAIRLMNLNPAASEWKSGWEDGR